MSSFQQKITNQIKNNKECYMHWYKRYLKGSVPEKTDIGLTGQDLKSTVLKTLKRLEETTDKEPKETERMISQ